MAFIVYKRDGLAIALLDGLADNEFPQVRTNQVDEFSGWELDDSLCEGENWKVWPEELVVHEILPLMRELVERASMYNSHEKSIRNNLGVSLMKKAVDVWEKRMREKRGESSCLLKCFSVESAKATLNSRRIRFSHPDAFNDLMEGQCEWEKKPKRNWNMFLRNVRNIWRGLVFAVFPKGGQGVDCRNGHITQTMQKASCWRLM